MAACAARALKRVSRTNQNTLPWNWFVPALVTAFTDAPDERPIAASCALVLTRNSCSASGNGIGMLVPSNRLLLIAPSSRYCTPKRAPPATEMLTPVTMVAMTEFGTCTAAPENVIRSVTCSRGERQLEDALSFDDGADAHAARLDLDVRRARLDGDRFGDVADRSAGSTTRLALTCSVMPDCTNVWKPWSVASRRYGPTGRFGNVYDADLVGDRRSDELRLGLRHRHGDARQHGARRVGDATADLPGGDLRVGHGRAGQGQPHDG